MRTYYAYIRVSTVKQGEKGSSLTEQKDAIERYAAKHGLAIVDWFEEQETAAKRGRAVFRRMLTQIKKGRANGLIMHKVDRGSRNMTDWAELNSLMDAGIAVHFAHEAIDLASRGGRLSADIQAVIAADFIRNLRDEVKKGIYGRLKQGIYPFGAPPGYSNNGKGQLKTIDPVQGPLVREAFELYASGRFSLYDLRIHMNTRGLRNSGGRPFYMSGLAHMLRNPFYYGLMIVQGQSFIGAHEPLISKELFDAVRARAEGRLVSANPARGRREYRYRRLLSCANCNGRLVAETQRGHAYYRCHARTCKGTCVREERITEAIALPLSYLPMPPMLEAALRQHFIENEGQAETARTNRLASLSLRLSQISARLVRLTDLFIDGALDQATYESRRTDLLNERLTLEGEHAKLSNRADSTGRVEAFIEHALTLRILPQLADASKIRQTAIKAISNIKFAQNNVEIQWSKAFEMLIDLGGFLLCAHERQAYRTCIQSVTVCDGPPVYPMSANEFRKALHQRGDVLFNLILSDTVSRKETVATNDNGETLAT
jgi:site-specific DNA recombinase